MIRPVRCKHTGGDVAYAGNKYLAIVASRLTRMLTETGGPRVTSDTIAVRRPTTLTRRTKRQCSKIRSPFSPCPRTFTI
jgi:hypothetical protein